MPELLLQIAIRVFNTCLGAFVGWEFGLFILPRRHRYDQRAELIVSIAVLGGALVGLFRGKRIWASIARRVDREGWGGTRRK